MQKILCKGLHVYGTGIHLWWSVGQRKVRNLSWIRVHCTLDWFILFTKNELSTCVLCCEGLMDVTSGWQIKWIPWSMSKHCICRGMIEYVCFIYLNSSNTDIDIFLSTWQKYPEIFLKLIWIYILGNVYQWVSNRLPEIKIRRSLAWNNNKRYLSTIQTVY